MDLMKIALWFDAEELARLREWRRIVTTVREVVQLGSYTGDQALVDKITAAEERLEELATDGTVTSSRGITYQRGVAYHALPQAFDSYDY
jgi:hypothetical protein